MESPESKPFGHHIRASFKLGVPLVAAQLAQMAVPVIDTLMLGWYGVDELAAGTLAFQLFFIFMIFGLGLGAAMMALIPSAIGEKNEQAVRQTTRMGFWALAILATLFQIPLFFTADLLQAMGQ